MVVPDMGIVLRLKKIMKFSACAEMSGIPRPDSLDKLQCKDRPNQVKDANALVLSLIHVLEGLDLKEAGHGPLLVVWAHKIFREATAGEACRELWHGARRSANGSDGGTCGSVAV